MPSAFHLPVLPVPAALFPHTQYSIHERRSGKARVINQDPRLLLHSRHYSHRRRSTCHTEQCPHGVQKILTKCASCKQLQYRDQHGMSLAGKGRRVYDLASYMGCCVHEKKMALCVIASPASM